MRILLIACLSLGVVLLVPLAGQAQAVEPADWAPPRTPDGHPDLQGVWDYRTMTPLERPTSLADKAFFTAEEAATYERESVARRDKDRRTEDGLSRIEASGTPAIYRQPAREGEGETDARALNITWSATDSQLTFEREAVIEQNGNLFRGDVIHYDTVGRVVTAEGGADTGEGSGRVEMVIQPRSTDRQGSDGSSESQ